MPRLRPIEELLERCGKLFFFRLSPFLFFFLTVFPLLGISLFLFLQNQRISDLETRFSTALAKEKASFARKSNKEAFLARYSDPDPYFLDREIESLSFLQEEKAQIAARLQHPAQQRKERLIERLAFLDGEENRLRFREETLRASGKIKETDEIQAHPVQMDESDLQKLLSRVEDVPIGPYPPTTASPQLLIQDMKIKKIETPVQTEVFEVEMHLLKREFTKK